MSKDNPTEPSEKRYTAGEVEILRAIDRLEIELAQMKEDAHKYVSVSEFLPIQRIVYGMVGVILLAFFGALVALVVIKP